MSGMEQATSVRRATSAIALRIILPLLCIHIVEKVSTCAEPIWSVFRRWHVSSHRIQFIERLAHAVSELCVQVLDRFGREALVVNTHVVVSCPVHNVRNRARKVIPNVIREIGQLIIRSSKRLIASRVQDDPAVDFSDRTVFYQNVQESTRMHVLSNTAREGCKTRAVAIYGDPLGVIVWIIRPSCNDFSQWLTLVL